MLPDAIETSVIKRVLVVMLRHHGDVLLTSPVFTVLKRALPDAEIDALVYRETVPMLLNHPSITIVHSVDRSRNHSIFGRWQKERHLLKALRARRIDLLVLLGRHWRGWRLSWQLRPRYVVGPDYSDWRWRLALTHAYPDNLPGRHRVELNLDALRRLGIQPMAGERRLVCIPGSVAEVEIDAICAQYALIPGAFIHVHPGSRWQFKCWPSERFAALVDRLAGHGERIVVTGAPDEWENQYISQMAALCQHPFVNLTGRLSLQSLAALTARAKLFIGMDSAPMHIAAAMGTPVVALFGPTKEVEWGPWRTSSVIVHSRHHLCRPCNRDGCGGGKVSECLLAVSVQDVFDAVLSLMNSVKRV